MHRINKQTSPSSGNAYSESFQRFGPRSKYLICLHAKRTPQTLTRNLSSIVWIGGNWVSLPIQTITRPSCSTSFVQPDGKVSAFRSGFHRLLNSFKKNTSTLIAFKCRALSSSLASSSLAGRSRRRFPEWSAFATNIQSTFLVDAAGLGLSSLVFGVRFLE